MFRAQRLVRSGDPDTLGPPTGKKYVPTVDAKSFTSW